MQLARSGVRIVDALDVVLGAQDLVELSDVVGQIVDIDGGVLDIFPRFGIANHITHQPLPRLAQLPDLLPLVTPEHRGGVAKSGGFPILDESRDLLFGLGTVIAADFHD